MRFARIESTVVKRSDLDVLVEEIAENLESDVGEFLGGDQAVEGVGY